MREIHYSKSAAVSGQIKLRVNLIKLLKINNLKVNSVLSISGFYAPERVGFITYYDA